MQNPELYIEALIFASSQSISISEIQQLFNSIDETSISAEVLIDSIDKIKQKYDNFMKAEYNVDSSVSQVGNLTEKMK